MKIVGNERKPRVLRKKSQFCGKKQIYVYGTDYLSTNDILEYFKSHSPDKAVEWINDSSCVVVFASKEAALNAYQNGTLESENKQKPKFVFTNLRHFEKIEFLIVFFEFVWRGLITENPMTNLMNPEPRTKEKFKN